MNIIYLDFETYYSKEYTLSKMTYDAYINDPRFQVIGVGVRVDNKSYWVNNQGNKVAEFLTNLDISKYAVCMHNAMFDAAILAFHYHIYPKIILDTLSMARALHGMTVGNSLKRLAEHYDVGRKGEEVHNFIDYRLEHFNKDELAAYGYYCKNDVELTQTIFEKMQSHFNASELKLIDMTIRMYSEPKFMYDRDFLEQHLTAVRFRQQKLLSDLGLTATDLRSNPKFAQLLRDNGVAPPMKLNANGIQTYALAKTDEGLKALLEHENEVVAQLAAARLGVKSSLEETRCVGLIEAGDRNVGHIPIGLSYYGARSGRFSGTQSLQFQNLPNKSDIKKGIIAPPGQTIIGIDLSNIELRVGLYFANQMDKLKLLQDGLDLYKDFASSIFSVAYDDVTKDQRFIAKTSQLSLIYGTGATRLREAIKTGSGTDIGEVEARRIVASYRTEYSNVVTMWKLGGEVLNAISNNKHSYFGHGNVCAVEGNSGILMPSGLHMTYPNLRWVAKDSNNPAEGKEWQYDKSPKLVDRIYNAKCFQNVVQGLARCVLGEAMVRIHKQYPIALTVHDSLYCIVRNDDKVQSVFDWIMEQMVAPPEWMPGIVLAAEGSWGKTLKDV